MAESSGISWTDATWNGWIGCTKVGPPCDNCYAERDFDLRKGRVKWGSGNPRSRTKTWGDPPKWNANPARLIGDQWPGRRPRVFAFSLSDFADNEVPDQWHVDAWGVVEACRNIEWLIVTKRIGNIPGQLPPTWCKEKFDHIVLIITVGNHQEAARDIPKLLRLKRLYPWLRVGLSIEPILGHIDLDRIYLDFEGSTWVDWVICGGESGPHARAPRVEWIRAIRDQCAAAGIPFHFKQWGEWLSFGANYPGAKWNAGRWSLKTDGRTFSGDKLQVTDDGEFMVRVGKVAAGRLLDGFEHNGFPEAA